MSLITLNYDRRYSEAILEWCKQTSVALHRFELANYSARKIRPKTVAA